ncbi:MAG: hypothetical protein K1X94_21915 [Sandaracinaceae bacterium]|nr:hypothetical protein [Sandaracinaceae bacterium]
MRFLDAIVRAGALGSLCAVVGCQVDNAGVAPTPGALNFPVAVAVTPESGGRQFLLVASSNFDLRYNAGALHSFDLAGMRAAIASCAEPPCTFEDLSSYMVSEVLIGSYTSGMAMSPRGDRVYLAVRSEVDLSWIDFDPASGALSCEGAGQPESCGDRRRTTDVATTCGRTLTLSGDPVGLVAGSVGELTGESSPLDYVVMVHRNGRASLFLDRMVGASPEPWLVHTTDGLPLDIVNVSYEPTSHLVWTHTASIIGTRQTRNIGFAGVAYDSASPECSSVFSAGVLPLLGIDDGFDTRDSAFAPDGSRAYVLARRPEAILTIDLESQPLFPGQAAIDRVSAVGYAPSRLDRLEMSGRSYLAATCFDDRKVWFVDAETGATAGAVPGFQGPYELAVDQAGSLVWVVDFRDSVLRAIDTAPLADGREPRLVATFGRVRPVQVLR